MPYKILDRTAHCALLCLKWDRADVDKNMHICLTSIWEVQKFSTSANNNESMENRSAALNHQQKIGHEIQWSHILSTLQEDAENFSKKYSALLK